MSPYVGMCACTGVRACACVCVCVRLGVCLRKTKKCFSWAQLEATWVSSHGSPRDPFANTARVAPERLRAVQDGDLGIDEHLGRHALT